MMIDQFEDKELDAAAKRRNKRFKRWVGIKSGTSKRRYLCRLCNNMIIATESANYPLTKHATQDILAHKAIHMKKEG